MARITHEEVEVAIIGGGPASLILSYILHGHIPYYVGKHHDALLDSKLQPLQSLLDITPNVYSHFGSSLRYSQQAQPINALLDTLVRPNADTEIDPESHVEWRHEPERAVSHVVLTGSARAGGQWSTVSTSRSDEIGTLSYAEMLSLPGYSFKDHYRKLFGDCPADLMRPPKKIVASYYAAYPAAVGIAAAIRTNSKVTRVSRNARGFTIEPMRINCKQLVLATGIFTHQISPPPALAPLQDIDNPSLPLLVVGSGFSAADAIISAPSQRKIIHLFIWNPTGHPSPLRGCHHQAYPEYAGVYRQMKAAASQHAQAVSPMLMRRKTNPFFKQRDWSTVYEGSPNAAIQQTRQTEDGLRLVLRLENGTVIEREVGGLAYHVGRRGSFSYLDPPLLHEVLHNTSAHHSDTANGVQQGLDEINDSQYLRRGGTRNGGALVAPSVYAIGSLTGDSLVRHAFGVCIDAAGHIIWSHEQANSNANSSLQHHDHIKSQLDADVESTSSVDPFDEERDGQSGSQARQHESRAQVSHANGWTHNDLHIDRRDLAQNKKTH